MRWLILLSLSLSCGALPDEGPRTAVVGETCAPDTVACVDSCTARCSDAGVWYVARCNPKCGNGLNVVTP